MELTAEQKMQLLTALAKSGATISQLNLGDGTQNFYLGKDEEKKPTFACDAEVVMEEASAVRHAKPLYPFVTSTAHTDAVISKILSYLEGKAPSQAKDVMKPLRAAQDAGVIRRITYEEMKAAFPAYCPASKASVSKYTKEDEMPYIDQAFKDMVEDFRAQVGGHKSSI